VLHQIWTESPVVSVMVEEAEPEVASTGVTPKGATGLGVFMPNGRTICGTTLGLQ
jgi:hypothetical protein